MEQAGCGVGQYVILGAGLDTFAQRQPEIASGLRIFDVDQPGPQAWKRQRLIELGFGIPEWLRLAPVDFQAGDFWWERLKTVGFVAGQPAAVSSTGVSMYLTKDATAATLRQVAVLAPGSTLAMTFILPLEFAEPVLKGSCSAVWQSDPMTGIRIWTIWNVLWRGAARLTDGRNRGRHAGGRRTLGERFHLIGIMDKSFPRLTYSVMRIQFQHVPSRRRL